MTVALAKAVSGAPVDLPGTYLAGVIVVTSRLESTLKKLALLLAIIFCAIPPAIARNLGDTSPRVLLFANGDAGVGVAGQSQINLNSGTEVTYTFSICNDGADEILLQMDVVSGTELTTPTFEPQSSTVTPGPVGRIPVGRCVDLGNFSSSTAVVQGETTTEPYSIWGKR